METWAVRYMVSGLADMEHVHVYMNHIHILQLCTEHTYMKVHIYIYVVI